MSESFIEQKDVPSKVRSIIAEQLGYGTDEVKDDQHIIDDLAADSLDIVELVMAMEEEFDIEVEDEEAEKLVTVGKVIAFINKELSR